MVVHEVVMVATEQDQVDDVGGSATPVPGQMGPRVGETQPIRRQRPRRQLHTLQSPYTCTSLADIERAVGEVPTEDRTDGPGDR